MASQIQGPQLPTEPTTHFPAPSGGAQGAFESWKTWLGPSATDEDVRQLFRNMCDQINREIRKEQAQAQKAAKKLKKALLGEEDSE